LTGQQLYTNQAVDVQDIASDILDLSMTIHVADWLSRRQNEQRCKIHVELPLRCSARFSGSQLAEILRWFTEDEWSFSFSAIKQRSDQQLTILPQAQSRQEIALWSGGLDSLAGLWNRSLVNSNDQFVLIGAGANRRVKGIQRKVFRGVREKLVGRTLQLRQPSFILSNIALSRNGQSRVTINDRARTRGLVFMLVGAACALLEGGHELYVYENGIGALNLPYAGAVGLDHTRSVHPLSLIHAGKLISDVIGRKFAIHNPFLFHTKGQMCAALGPHEVLLVAATTSCDRPQRALQRPVQCGCCSSCLLRRQALDAAGMIDRTTYWKQNIISEANVNSFLPAMSDQVRKLKTCIDSVDPWSNLLLAYPDLSKTADTVARDERVPSQAIQERFTTLFRNYVREWDAFEIAWGEQSKVSLEA
jgi:hypothetical protein